MKILYLAHRIPYPPNKGDKIRSFNEIKYLSKNYEIHLCCLADDPRDLRYANNLKTYCKDVYIVTINPKIAKLKSIFFLFSHSPLSIPYFYSQKLQRAVNHLLATNTFDYILCFSSPMAEYIFRSKVNKKYTPQLIMDFCDVDSHKWAQYGRNSAFPISSIYALESRRLANYERKVAEQFDHLIVISEKEAEIFRDQNPQIKRIAVIPNGVDYEYFNPARIDHVPSQPLPYSYSSMQQGRFPILLFTGAMDYYANIDGVIWFCKNIYPQIKQSIPETQFYIVGSNPHKKIKNLQNTDNGIKVTGFVEDIRPYYKSAAICTIPLRLGRGIQNKVLEAMAMGRAIVATSKALEGIKAVPGEHLLVEDNPEGISRAVVMLLKDDIYRTRLGRNARQYVMDQYKWSANMEKFEALMQRGDLISR